MKQFGVGQGSEEGSRVHVVRCSSVLKLIEVPGEFVCKCEGLKLVRISGKNCCCSVNFSFESWTAHDAH